MRVCIGVPKGWKSNDDINGEFDKLYPRLEKVIEAKTSRVFGLVWIDKDDLKQEGFATALVGIGKFDSTKARDQQRSDDSLMAFIGKMVDDTFQMIVCAALSQKRMPHIWAKDYQTGELIQIECRAFSLDSDGELYAKYKADTQTASDVEDGMIDSFDQRYELEILRVFRQRVLKELAERAKSGNVVANRALEAYKIRSNPPFEFVDKFVKNKANIRKTEIAQYMGLTRNQMDFVASFIGEVCEDIANDISRKISKTEK